MHITSLRNGIILACICNQTCCTGTRNSDAPSDDSMWHVYSRMLDMHCLDWTFNPAAIWLLLPSENVCMEFATQLVCLESHRRSAALCIFCEQTLLIRVPGRREHRCCFDCSLSCSHSFHGCTHPISWRCSRSLDLWQLLIRFQPLLWQPQVTSHG